MTKFHNAAPGENCCVTVYCGYFLERSNWLVFSHIRIVELGHIIDQLRQCGACGLEINLTNTKSEQRYGFGSVLTVECTNCGFTNKIETNKRHRHDDSQKGPKSFVINTKAAIGKCFS